MQCVYAQGGFSPYPLSFHKLGGSQKNMRMVWTVNTSHWAFWLLNGQELILSSKKPSWYFHFVSDLWLVNFGENKSPGWKRWRTRGPKLILALPQAYVSFINKYLFITCILTCFHSLNNLVDYCGASSVEERLAFQPLSHPNMEITLNFMLI